MTLARRFTLLPAALLCGIPLLVLAEGGASPPGEAMFRRFLEEEVRDIAERSLADLGSRESWEARRRELRLELKEMLGLWPEPSRGDLRATVTGIVEREDLGIAVEKLHFQSLPGLYVTANLYRPRKVEGRIPAVLYLCGHGTVKIDGVPFGAKAHYQHHPAWFARNGAVSLVIDTLQFGEIEGLHHGTYRLDMWWWVSRGYTPAGVEAWNSIRALDYLERRPEVDPERLGVTGRSGGGIGTWWLAALDDRPRALAPVAGITDLSNHILDGAIDGHCDCNYPVNLYRWDYPQLAALAAPRPLLLSNTDKDPIFPLDGVLRIHRKLKGIYGLLEASEHLGLLITEGPHADTQELQVPVFRWMDRWLSSRVPRAVSMGAERIFEPRELKVFQELPADQRNTTIQETFVPAAAAPEVPRSISELEALRADLLSKLRAKTFRNAPDPELPLEIEPVASAERGGILLRGFRFLSERNIRLPLWALSAPKAGEPQVVTLRVVDEKGWEAFGAEAGADFAGELGGGGERPGGTSGGGHARAEAMRDLLEREKRALWIFPPRGIGPTRAWNDPKRENAIRRRFLSIGRTLEETRVHDVRRAIRALGTLEPFPRAALSIEGEREMAGVALYAGLFEPGVARFDLRSLPPSHHQGIALLNVLRVLDIPQAVALLFPRRVHLPDTPPRGFEWTQRAAALFQGSEGKGASPLSFKQLAQ